MTDTLDPALLNFAYALLGALLTLALMWVGCGLLCRLSGIDIRAELERGNQAVGLLAMGGLIGLGLALGLVIGMALN